jgi:hypothetical protein
MSWNRVVEKFDRLSEAYADDSLRGRIIEAVLQLDARPISDLMDLLARFVPLRSSRPLTSEFNEFPGTTRKERR